MKTMQGLTSSYYRNIEELRGRNDPEAIKAITKEMEALFIYQMIKTMRETAVLSSKDSFGSNTYMSMFDLEIARLFAERGLGLQDMLIKGLNREIKRTESSEVSPQPIGNQNTTSQFQSLELTKDSAVQNPQSSIDDTLSLPVDGIISSRYGMRKHPLSGDKRFHHGMDIAAPAGTYVYPIKDGEVIFSGEQEGYGKVVIIDHGNGLISKYAHNEVNIVREGDVVDINTVIAKVGSTGKSTGSHLHLEVRENGRSINPLSVIRTA